MKQICRQATVSCTKEILNTIFKVEPSLARVEQVSGEMDKEQEQATALEAKKETIALQHLKEQIATCTDHIQLLRLLQADQGMGRMMMAEAPVEGGTVAAGVEREYSKYCCHHCDQNLG